MRIGIDLDRVLFDTDSFDDFYKDKVEGLHHVEDPAPVRHGCYDPEMHAEICGIPKQRIWNVFDHDLSDFVFADVDILDQLSNHELILVTRGHQKFQKRKAEASGIAEKMDEVHVVQEEPKDSVEIDLLVDDSDEELERVRVPGIQIKRPGEGLEKILKELEDLEA